jgi:flagellar M-ring protein FliF
MSFLDSFKAYSPSRQILVAALAAASMSVVLVGAYFLVLHKPYDVLFSHLRAPDAAAVVAALDAKKTPYKLEDGGTTIRVPRDQIDSTRLTIAGEDLPMKGAVGFELFNKSDMGLTEFAQQINYQRALQGELARTIMSLESIEAARVHLMLAEPSVFRDDRRPSKAAVTIAPRAGRTISAPVVQGIQRLVAAAVPDLSADDVVVLDASGAVLSGISEGRARTPPATQEQAAIEQYYVSRIRQAIGSVYAGQTDVDVMLRPDVGQDLLSAWNPTARAFPLAVVISLSAAPAADVAARIRALTSEAAGLDAAKGDTLTLTVAPTSEGDRLGERANPSAAARWARPAVGGKAAGGASQLLLFLAVAVAAAVMLTVSVVWYGQSQRPRRLGERQRAEMAARLRKLLDEREAHAPVGS